MRGNPVSVMQIVRTVRPGLLHLLHHQLAAGLQSLDVVGQPAGAVRRNRRAQRLDLVLHALQPLAIVLQFDAQPLLAEQLPVHNVG